MKPVIFILQSDIGPTTAIYVGPGSHGSVEAVNYTTRKLKLGESNVPKKHISYTSTRSLSGGSFVLVP